MEDDIKLVLAWKATDPLKLFPHPQKYDLVTLVGAITTDNKRDPLLEDSAVGLEEW
jgi:hypothetical protein